MNTHIINSLIQKILIITGLLLFHLNSFGQEQAGLTFGGAQLDRGIHILKTADNTLLMTGYTESFGKSSNIYMVKTDLKGKKVWEQNFGGEGDDVGWHTEEIDGGLNYLVAGFSDSYGSNLDITVSKITKDGKLVWNKHFPNPGEERCWSMKKLNDGNFILVGQTRDKNTKNYDGLVTKINKEGEIIWQKKYGGDTYDRLFHCIEISNGDLLFGGIMRKDSVADNNGWALLTDAQGREKKSSHLSSLKNITAHGLIPISKKKILLYGYAQTDTAKNQRSVYFAILDNKGSLISEKTTDDKGSINHALSAALTTNAHILVIGYTKPLSSGKWDGVIYKFNKNGEFLWKKSFGGNEIDQPYAIAEVSDQEYAITGVTHSFGLGKGDLWLIKINNNGEILSDN